MLFTSFLLEYAGKRVKSRTGGLSTASWEQAVRVSASHCPERNSRRGFFVYMAVRFSLLNCSRRVQTRICTRRELQPEFNGSCSSGTRAFTRFFRILPTTALISVETHTAAFIWSVSERCRVAGVYCAGSRQGPGRSI